VAAWLVACQPLGAAGVAAPGDLHGSFIQEKRVSGLPQALKSRGDFVLLKGQGLVWRTLSPVQGTVVLGTGGVWALDSAGASRRLAGGGEALQLMGRLLGQDRVGLEQLFQISALPAASGFHQALVPKTPLLQKLFRRVEIWGPAPGQVSKAALSETSGDSTLIRFEAVTAGPAPLQGNEEALLVP
jgi:hypothetical protein